MAVTYVPILKGKLGELNALQEIGPAERRSMLPLLEIVPPSLDEDDASEIGRGIRKFIDRLEGRWVHDLPIVLDAGYFADVPLEGGQLPVTFAISRAISSGLNAIPVVRPSDSAEVQQSVAASVEQNGGSVCVRLGTDDLDDEIAPIGEVLRDLLTETRALAERSHLLLDFGVVSEDSSTFAVRMATFVLLDIPDLEAWASVTVASGAFPSELSSVPPWQWGEFIRSDWAFWEAVAERIERRNLRVPSFGDYAIAHPAMSQGPGFAPAPQIRYTTDTHWIVLRGRKSVRRGHAQIYDICERLVRERADDFPGSEFSWGDNWIYHAAMSADDGAPQRVTTGNAATWRSVGTSHHLALVVNRLASRFSA